MSETGRDFWDAAVTMTPAAQKIHALTNITSPYATSRLDITVFVSCLNQEATIIDTLATVVEAMGVVDKTFEILVIDDCSADSSAELVRGYMTEYPTLNIVLRINKDHKGLARNYLDGAFIGCGQYYRLVHGDNSEPVETMVDVLRTIGEADIVIPYYLSMRRKGFWESFAIGSFTWFVNFISGNKVNYYGESHMHLRYNVVRWHPNTLGPAFQIDLLCRLLELGFTCKQAPCRTRPYHAYNKNFVLKKLFSHGHFVLDILLRKLSYSLNGR